MITVQGLPDAYLPSTPAALRSYLHDVSSLLSSLAVDSIIRTHPNQVALATIGDDSRVPTLWREWWTSLEHIDDNALKGLVAGDDIPPDIPSSLADVLQRVRSLQLCRDSINPHDGSRLRAEGMSSKKAHEVARLSSLIRSICDQVPERPVRHVVDAGAGQGYLSRALADTGLHVLALESDEVQVKGAARRAGNPGAEMGDDAGEVTYRTSLVDAKNLAGEIDAWITSGEETRPVVLTGLHACGPLTPAVLRSFADLVGQGASRGTQWEPHALVIVGCCYNFMMDSADFPLASQQDDIIKLSFNHLHVACQCPAQWVLSDDEWERSRLAHRKVLYRALLGRLYQEHNLPPLFPGQTDVTTEQVESLANPLEGKRMGRLPDSAYTSFTTFLSRALPRLGDITLATTSEGLDQSVFARRFLGFTVIRSLLGPLIESAIIVDRVLFLAEALPDGWSVRSENVFELSSGSARNVAIIAERE